MAAIGPRRLRRIVPMKHASQVGALLSILALLLLPVAAHAAPTPPNIVLLYGDDAGYIDFSFQPGAAKDIATPHIDSIAKAGVRYSNAYMSAPVCSPSRAGMLTGRYQNRFGHENNIPPGYMKGGMDLKQKTMADRLKALGYVTGMVGKWHLGYPPEYHPNKRGFDWFFGLLQGSRGYFPAKNPTAHRVIQENGKPTKEEGYITDRFGDAAVRFIEKNKDKRFFLYLSFTAPHGPLQPKEPAKGRRAKFVGLMKSLDENVGKVLAALKKHDLEKNTLVVFTNDNGGQTRVGANNGGLRGRKGQLYEGGIRVPMCLRWPGKVEAGSVDDRPVISLDLLPTFLALSDNKAEGLDGVDLFAEIERRPLFWRFGKQRAMRFGDYKLYVSDSVELYNLKLDVGEQTNIAEKQPERAGVMRKLLAAWEAGLEAPRWEQPGRKRRNRKK